MTDRRVPDTSCILACPTHPGTPSSVSPLSITTAIDGNPHHTTFWEDIPQCDPTALTYQDSSPLVVQLPPVALSASPTSEDLPSSEAPPAYHECLPPSYSALDFSQLSPDRYTDTEPSQYILEAPYPPLAHDKALYVQLFQAQDQPHQATPLITAQPQSGDEPPRPTFYDLFSKETHRRTTWLSLSILTCLVCNCIFGSIAIWFSVKSSTAYARGDISGARRHADIALKLVICGIIMTVMILVFLSV